MVFLCIPGGPARSVATDAGTARVTRLSEEHRVANSAGVKPAIYAVAASAAANDRGHIVQMCVCVCVVVVVLTDLCQLRTQGGPKIWNTFSSSL